MAGTLRGGKRDRMVIESVLRAVRDELAFRDWFDPGREHLPITLINEYPDTETEVALNTLAISFGDSFSRLVQLGNMAELHNVPIFFDFFAESDALKYHVAGDIYAWINEQHIIPVWDYDLATPVVDFNLEVLEESAEKQYPPRATNPWLKHWVTVSFIVSDQRENA